MNHELSSLFLIGLGYLGCLFLLAWLTDTGRIPHRWVAHPLTYTLSLGVYATSWSYYGSIGLAAEHGLLFLTIYLGATLTFVLAPVLLQPILRLTSEYQLTSLADLLAFRYRSQAIGILVTLFMLVGTLPYIALQIRAVAESMHILSDRTPPQMVALGFCVTLILFAMLFGARHLSSREKHQGLVAAIAFESLVKLVVILIIGLVALFQVLQGPEGLAHYLQTHPQALQNLYQPLGESPWTALLFLAFSAAFLLPRQFHMLFAENLQPQALKTASWALPGFLLLLNLPIPLILWAGQSTQADLAADYLLLGVALHNGPSWLSILAFIGGLSAASAMVIVTSLALASMLLNHVLLPASYPDPEMNLYRRILWGRRLLIATMIMCGYLVYINLGQSQGLVELGLISFVAVAQFLPGVVGLLFWRRANRIGMMLGLLGGASIWTLVLIAPMMHQAGILLVDIPVEQWIAWSGLHKWSFVTFLSVSVNAGLMILFSLLTRQTAQEQETAAACVNQHTATPEGVVAARSPEQFRIGLAQTLGETTATRELALALEDLDMSPHERRPAQLRRLRDRIERNLSGLVGPQLAQVIVERRLTLDPRSKTALADSISYIEERLEASRSELHGLNIELDNLRRLHRQILHDLPLGVCATDQHGQIVLWNQALQKMTGVNSPQILSSPLDLAPAPWNELLGGFARAEEQHVHRLQLAVNGSPRWYNLHKSRYAEPIIDSQQTAAPGMVMILEDLTDLSQLEAELTHSDRLASIGRLAAGVAHEIGNPITGIASLAQNLRYESDQEVVKQSIQDIIEQTKRIATILRTLQSFSRGGMHAAKLERFDLHEVIKEAKQLAELTHKQRQVRLVSDCALDIQLVGNRQSIAQVLVNLLNNAIDASSAGDQVSVFARSDVEKVIIQVEDQGAGIPEPLRELVFEPFYTSKPTGKGTGLGLTLAHRIIEDHAGRLWVEPAVSGGTRFCIELRLNGPEVTEMDMTRHFQPLANE